MFPTLASCESETTDSHSSLDVNLPDDLQGEASWQPDSSALLAVLPSSPATPPPDLHFMAGHHTMSGIGFRFPDTLPSRASTITLEGDDAIEMPSSVETTTGSVDVLTPKAPKTSTLLDTPTPAMHAVFGNLYPLTPSPTPIRRKRTADPPSPPRAKRSKITEQASTNSEDEGYSEPRTAQLHDIRQLTVDLAGSTGFVIDFDHSHCPDIEMSAGPKPPSSLQKLDTASCADEGNSDKPVFSLAIEHFSESEIEEELSSLLGVYRSFYLDSDIAEAATPRDPEGGRRARQIFKAVFENQLNSAESEEFLLQEEEEDVLDVFATWIREMKISEDMPNETFDNMTGCLKRLADLTTAPFIRRILFDDGLLLDQLPSFKGACEPTRQADGTFQWEFGNIFRDFEKLHLE
ncbi:hypothetical protein QBC38DRAFT_360252 [Podospora fimiseda]|uniref:Uncharacterized protein n=1 Tax=Podospora fimiseda TaxID=252190 RepID=A0AAN7BTA1_9PEZI|nr:hypothetical protein QBC38DRAFT_360252 [Podospora fimiseda]